MFSEAVKSNFALFIHLNPSVVNVVSVKVQKTQVYVKKCNLFK